MMNATEQQYRKHWATLTGKSEREIYVPLALREEEPTIGPAEMNLVEIPDDSGHHYDRPLEVRDIVRILEDWHMSADVRTGDLLIVKAVGAVTFETDTPRLAHAPSTWEFHLTDEGIGWERVRW